MADESTMHIKAMVVKQKTNKKKKRRSVCGHNLHKVSHKSYINPLGHRNVSYRGLTITASGGHRSVNPTLTPKRISGQLSDRRPKKPGLLGDGPNLLVTQKAGQKVDQPPRRRFGLLGNQPQTGPIGNNTSVWSKMGSVGNGPITTKSSKKMTTRHVHKKFVNPFLRVSSFDEDQAGDWITESSTSIPGPASSSTGIPKISKSSMSSTASVGTPKAPRSKVKAKATKNKKIVLNRNFKLSPVASKNFVPSFINPLMTRDQEKTKKMISTIPVKQEASSDQWKSHFLDISDQENFTEVEINEEIKKRILKILETYPQGLASSQFSTVYQEAFKCPLSQHILFGLECGQIKNTAIIERRTCGNREKIILHPVTKTVKDAGRLRKYKTPSGLTAKMPVHIPEAVDLEPGAEVMAGITYIEDCNNFTIQLVESRNDLKRIEHVLRGVGRQEEEIKSGMYVVTDHHGRGRRAKVLSVHDKEVTVYHVDFGDVQKTVCDKLYRLPSEIASIPELARHCNLHRPEGVEWPSSITSKFAEFCEGTEIRICVYSVIKTSGRERSTVYSVTCYVNQFNINFRLLMEAQKKKSHRNIFLPGKETKTSSSCKAGCGSSKDGGSNSVEQIETKFSNQHSMPCHPGQTRITSRKGSEKILPWLSRRDSSQDDTVSSRTGDQCWNRVGYTKFLNHPKTISHPGEKGLPDDGDRKSQRSFKGSSSSLEDSQSADIRDSISKLNLSRRSKKGCSGFDDSSLSSRRARRISCDSLDSFAITESSSISFTSSSQDLDVQDPLATSPDYIMPVFMKISKSFKIPASLVSNIDFGRILPVKVMNVFSPDFFYMIPVVRIPILETVTSWLTSFHQENSNNICIPKENLQTGMLCAVPSMCNGTIVWQRGCILQMIPDFASVRLIDRGSVDCVPTCRIKPLANGFDSFPPLCIMGRLGGIKPKSTDDWPANISKRFENRVMGMQFEAHIVRTRIHPDGEKLVNEVCLCDMAMGEEWINDTMVEEWRVAEYVI